MKIKDIISEEVDIESFWNPQDEDYNPEAHEYANREKKRQKVLRRNNKTPVFNKPVLDSEPTFDNEPKEGEAKSLGYIGNVSARVKAGHISREKGKKLSST